MEIKKVFLNQSDMPRQWYNIAADMPTPMQPPLHPGTGQPIGPDDLAPIFPMNLIEQEVSTQRWIDIPEEVLEILAIWRPSPLTRAYNLEKFLGTPAKIYFKDESVSPPAATSPTQPLLRHTIIKLLESSVLLPKQGPASGAVPSLWLVSSSA
jgi:tryptophan synthase beta chain